VGWELAMGVDVDMALGAWITEAKACAKSATVFVLQNPIHVRHRRVHVEKLRLVATAETACTQERAVLEVPCLRMNTLACVNNSRNHIECIIVHFYVRPGIITSSYRLLRLLRQNPCIYRHRGPTLPIPNKNRSLASPGAK